MLVMVMDMIAVMLATTPMADDDVRLMDKILHDPKDPKLWELWYIPYNGSGFCPSTVVAEAQGNL